MSSKINYYSKGNSVDGTNFCSGVETLAENLMEDNEADAVITFPSKDGWASLRSASYTMTTENTQAVLPLPIYKINRLVLKPVDLLLRSEHKVSTPGGDYVDTKYLDYTSFGIPEGIDITNFIKTGVEWKALKRAKTKIEYLTEDCQDNTFYWQSGECVVPFLSTQFTLPGDFIVTGLGLNDKTTVFLRLLSRALYGFKDKQIGMKSLGQMLEAYGAEMLRGPDEDDPYDIRNCLFRIEYVPITSSTKMRARKSAKTSLDFFQPFNQRAALNAVGAFGKNMWLTAQKTGVREIAIAKNYTRLADIPPLGALVHHNGKKYRLIANKYVQTNTVYMQVIHTLSENWTSKSKHVAVDQKFRNWSIPQDILWRNLYWEDFLVVSKTLPSNGVKGSIGVKYLSQIFQSERANDKEINAFFLHTVGRESTTGDSEGVWTTTKYGVASPCTAYPLGNSLVFSASMKDNLSAGLKRLIDENGQIVCEEVFYPKSDGTAEKMTIILSDGIGSGFYKKGKEWTGELTVLESDDARRMYPQMELAIVDDPNAGLSAALNSPVFPLFNETFVVEKDPAEALKFTYQIHFMEDDPDIVLGEALTAKHPLISKATKNRSFFVFVSSSYLREGEQMIPDGEFFYHNGEYFNTYLETNGDFGYFSLVLTMNFVQKIINKGESCKSWGIADADKRLIVGCNDTNARTLFFSLTHKR